MMAFKDFSLKTAGLPLGIASPASLGRFAAPFAGDRIVPP
jgi:hypothetical protein